MNAVSRAVLLLTAAWLAAAPVTALAQADYPSRPIKIIVPLAPGGTADILPRIIGEKLSARWGQPVVIENRAGGGQHIGTEAVARAEPDGYTLLASAAGPLVINPSLSPNLSYDPLAFAPVTIMASLPYVLVVNPKARRLRQGQSGQAQLCGARRRLADPARGRVAENPVRNEDDVRSL
jgi:tripartite-type tricarboxylate transporter receptor subunit TctC